MVSLATLVVDRFPILEKPAHWTYSALLKTKNAILFPMIRYLGYRPRSLSDRGQDKWVIDIFRGRREGYFLELGAADGFSESNTYVLEKYYGWRGLCIEPNPILFRLMTDRYDRACTCISDAIDSKSGQTEYLISGQESGILADDTDNNEHTRGSYIEKRRQEGFIRTVTTKTLSQVLDENSAPSTIDYFSFDVEGAETRILRDFPFDRYRFLALTIERPTPELNALLFKNGYRFARNSLYDSFYVHESIPDFDNIECEPFVQVPPKQA